ncbi:hypothetical protein WA158_005720 [Blastocystis sp. Blastoise]
MNNGHQSQCENGIPLNHYKGFFFSFIFGCTRSSVNTEANYQRLVLSFVKRLFEGEFCNRIHMKNDVVAQIFVFRDYDDTEIFHLCKSPIYDRNNYKSVFDFSFYQMPDYGGFAKGCQSHCQDVLGGILYAMDSFHSFKEAKHYVFLCSNSSFHGVSSCHLKTNPNGILFMYIWNQLCTKIISFNTFHFHILMSNTNSDIQETIQKFEIICKRIERIKCYDDSAFTYSISFFEKNIDIIKKYETILDTIITNYMHDE